MGSDLCLRVGTGWWGLRGWGCVRVCVGGGGGGVGGGGGGLQNCGGVDKETMSCERFNFL